MPVYKREPRSRGQSEGAQPYLNSFIKDVHGILAHGFRAMKGKDLTGHDEPAITGVLVRAIRSFLASDGCPPRWQRYHAQDEVPESDDDEVLRRGKQRPRVDIEFRRVSSGEHPVFKVEAKRLRDKDSLSDYLGSEGLGCFLTGRYSRKRDHAGMLGYVERGSLQEWAQRLQRALERHDSIIRDGNFWSRQMELELEHCYLTRHRRVNVGRTVHIYHTLLDFVEAVGGRGGT